MTTFITEFVNTSYYKQLIASEDTVAVIIGGSQAPGIVDEHSDYDLIVLTRSGSWVDVSRKYYLTYKDMKVHWYLVPLDRLTVFEEQGLLRLSGLNSLRNLRSELFIYTNPVYDQQVNLLYLHINEIADAGVYWLVKTNYDFIHDIVQSGKILEHNYSKRIYHLCLASYQIYREPFDVKFLLSIKRIRWQPVSDEYKQLAVVRLKKLMDYYSSLSSPPDCFHFS